MRDERLVVQFVLYGQLVHPALMARPHLVSPDDDEDAGQPVGDEDEADHQQAQDDSTVLRKSGSRIHCRQRYDFFFAKRTSQSSEKPAPV